MKNRCVLLVLILAGLCSQWLTAASFVVNDSVLRVGAGVSEISRYAFKDREDFHTVVFDSRSCLRVIGDYAFLGCRNLRSVELPASLTTIGEGAFRECESLEKIAIPQNCAKLPRYVFSWCSSLRFVSLPKTMRDIGSGCFSYCISLKEINFPGSIEHIGANAFSFCKSLHSVKLPRSVTELESYAFSECDSLVEAVLPANGHLLGELIFSGCRNLRSLTVNSTVPPPFDCESTIFENTETEMYRLCVLHVPGSAVEAYRKAEGWSLFEKIE